MMLIHLGSLSHQMYLLGFSVVLSSRRPGNRFTPKFFESVGSPCRVIHQIKCASEIPRFRFRCTDGRNVHLVPQCRVGCGALQVDRNIYKILTLPLVSSCIRVRELISLKAGVKDSSNEGRDRACQVGPVLMVYDGPGLPRARFISHARPLLFSIYLSDHHCFHRPCKSDIDNRNKPDNIKNNLLLSLTDISPPN